MYKQGFFSLLLILNLFKICIYRQSFNKIDNTNLDYYKMYISSLTVNEFQKHKIRKNILQLLKFVRNKIVFSQLKI